MLWPRRLATNGGPQSARPNSAIFPMFQPPLMESAPGPETVIDGRRYRYFAGTSYMGLHGHPEVIAAGCAAFERYGLHTATTRAGFGSSAPVLETESRAAAFAGREDAFYFSSGYAANHILTQAVGPVDAVFVDEAAHYCVREAARLAGAPVHLFHARDAEDLAAKLARLLPKSGRPLVMSDAVMPATGAMPPLVDYVKILAAYAPAVLLVDDAHGMGVLGHNGRGTLEYLGLDDSANGGPEADGVTLLSGGTLAKALGGFGGVITGSGEFMRNVRASSHYYDGASAPPAPVAAASAKSLELIAADPSLRENLRRNIAMLRGGLRGLGVDVHSAPTAQTGVAIGTAENMLRIHLGLKEAGFLVPAVAAYSGIGPEGVLRFAVCSGHTPEMIDDLLDTLRALL